MEMSKCGVTHVPLYMSSTTQWNAPILHVQCSTVLHSQRLFKMPHGVSLNKYCRNITVLVVLLELKAIFLLIIWWGLHFSQYFEKYFTHTDNLTMLHYLRFDSYMFSYETNFFQPHSCDYTLLNLLIIFSIFFNRFLRMFVLCCHNHIFWVEKVLFPLLLCFLFLLLCPGCDMNYSVMGTKDTWLPFLVPSILENTVSLLLWMEGPAVALFTGSLDVVEEFCT